MKERLDILLTQQGFFESREKARAAIMSGQVYINNVRFDKPGTAVLTSSQIEIRGNTCPYVSRGGYKLEKALDVFAVDPTGFICADAGASTGGFTDCLLQHGAQKIFAIDVGYGQLAWTLRNDARVVCMERKNLRYMTPDELGQPIDLFTLDVSFISLRLVLPAVASMLKPGGEVICLIKPQFEAGREQVGKKGVVHDPAVHLQVLQNFIADAASLGYCVRALSWSPIKGPEGNIEFLGYLQQGSNMQAELNPAEVVFLANEALKG